MVGGVLWNEREHTRNISGSCGEWRTNAKKKGTPDMSAAYIAPESVKFAIDIVHVIGRLSVKVILCSYLILKKMNERITDS